MTSDSMKTWKKILQDKELTLTQGLTQSITNLSTNKPESFAQMVRDAEKEHKNQRASVASRLTRFKKELHKKMSNGQPLTRVQKEASEVLAEHYKHHQFTKLRLRRKGAFHFIGQDSLFNNAGNARVQRYNDATGNSEVYAFHFEAIGDIELPKRRSEGDHFNFDEEQIRMLVDRLGANTPPNMLDLLLQNQNVANDDFDADAVAAAMGDE